MQCVLLQCALPHLLSVVLDGKAKDTLGFVTCDQVHLSIEPGVLERQNTYTELNDKCRKNVHKESDMICSSCTHAAVGIMQHTVPLVSKTNASHA